MMRDISEQMLLHYLMDNIPDLVFFKDRESKFIALNQAEADWLKVSSPAEAIGKTDFDFFPKEYAQKRYLEEQSMMEKRTSVVSEVHRGSDKGREKNWVSMTKIPIVDNADQVIGIVGVVRDISQLKETEFALEREQKKLSAAMNELQEELRIASSIQKSMLPDCTRPFPGFSVAVHFQPCQVIGGDFYDIIPLDNHRTALLVVDIFGHGVPAALVTALVKVSFVNQTQIFNQPDQVMQAINRSVYNNLPWRCSLTAFLGIFDDSTGTFSYSRAGHPPPFIIRSSMGVCDELDAQGPAIGLAPESKYEQSQVDMQSGDKILLFTDGVTECQNESGELFGKNSLKDILVREAHLDAGRLVAAVRREQESYLGGAVQKDDITLLAVQAE